MNAFLATRERRWRQEFAWHYPVAAAQLAAAELDDLIRNTQRGGPVRPARPPAPLRDDALGEPGIVGVQPAAPFRTPEGADAPDRLSAPPGGGMADPMPDLGAVADWREARQRLRRAGVEVKQFDGVLYVDGVISGDASLYPPDATVPF